jgi:hypothetical protein
MSLAKEFVARKDSTHGYYVISLLNTVSQISRDVCMWI